jgi:phosphoribosylglycinamide formyltransferase-1
MPEGIRIGALVSSKGNKLQAIMDACKTGVIKGRVVFVCSDNPDAYALTRAKEQQIPTIIVDYDEITQKFSQDPDSFLMPADCDFDRLIAMQKVFDVPRENLIIRLKARVIAEMLMLSEMAAYPFDLLVLAGFIRKLTPHFIDKVNAGCPFPRIMNLHATLCPAFPGVDGYGQTLRHGCKIAGCTVHFVDYGTDSGPIIDQYAFKIEPDDTIDSVKEKGISLECSVYPRCIGLFAERKLKLRENDRGRMVVDIIH